MSPRAVKYGPLVLQANNKYQEVFTSSIDELDRRILMQGVSYE